MIADLDAPLAGSTLRDQLAGPRRPREFTIPGDLETFIQELPIVEHGVVCVDFETYYDNECTLKKLGNYAYCRHPKWNAYLVSFFGTDKAGNIISYVGPPEDAPWDKLMGLRWLSHNRNFDRTVYERLVEMGLVPNVPYSEWDDTADLAVWCHLPRNLAGAAAYGMKVRISKNTRDVVMKGKNFSEFTAKERQEVIDYTQTDPVLAWALWQSRSPEWPEDERWVSRHTGHIETRGIPVNWELVDQYIRVLTTAKWYVESRIPWLTEKDEKGVLYKLGSYRAIDAACAKAGVPAPESTSAKSEEFQEWLEEYGEQVPALRELARHRKIKNYLDRLITLRSRRRPDGRAAVGLKYFGADKTGRWSGTAGFSLHNLPKAPLYFDTEYNWVAKKEDAVHSIDIRSVLTHSMGKLIIADLAQIEPRTLNWVVQNRQFLDYCASGMSPYEAHARAFMGWTGGELKVENPGLYALAKARVLALGYGAGWLKFIGMARGYMTDKDGNFNEKLFDSVFAQPTTTAQREAFLSFLAYCKKAGEIRIFREELDEKTRDIWTNAWMQVKSFRDNNPSLASRKRGEEGLWQQLDEGFKASVNDGFFENELPSGRSLMYYDISRAGGWSAKQGNPGSFNKRVYGGLLTENLIQAIARDVFAFALRALEQAGFTVLFHVHDEFIIDAPLDANTDDVLRIISQTPEWAKSLPVAAEAKESPFYQK